jgi:hypothetical protein
MYGKLPANRIGTRSAGGTITSTESGRLSVDPANLEAAKAQKIDQLWAAATEYERKFFSGGAYSLILVPQAHAIGQWIINHWAGYYARKASVMSMVDPGVVREVSLDFSSSGAPPYTVSDLMAIVSAAQG